MELDVTLTISVKLKGPIDSKTEINVYVPHLNKEFEVSIPNSITESQSLRLKGLGYTSSDGKKGDLYLKFDSVDKAEVKYNTEKCHNCGHSLAYGAKFCFECGSSVFSTGNNSQRQQEWAGKIFKCPSCGENLPSFTAICPACGHEFRGASSATSIRDFSLKLERANLDSEKINLIRTFPIPNTKEDILEFMILASTNIENSFQADVSEAWSVKFEQAYEKSQVIYGSLPEFERCHELFVKKKKANNKVIKQKEFMKKMKINSMERKIQSEKNIERFSNFFEKNKDWIVPIIMFSLVPLLLMLIMLIWL